MNDYYMVLLLICMSNMWRVLDKSGISQACYIVEISHSGLEPSMCVYVVSPVHLTGHLSVW